ncbi:hypothetical protein MRX96_030876 [Rhipicephalus microplus]
MEIYVSKEGMAGSTKQGNHMFENPPRLRECRELLAQLETLCASVDDRDREVSMLFQIIVVCMLPKELGANMDLYFQAKID